MSEPSEDSEHTPRTDELHTPLSDFLRTETGSAAVLLCATLAALAWANISQSSYEAFWRTPLSVRVGDHGLSLSAHEWVNSGLMTLFFFVVGIEARREFDMGELRDRRRLALPLVCGLSGMLLPVIIYLSANAGRSSVHGWGAAMSTDTAFALGMLSLLGSRLPGRLRTFILTIAVVDDLVALAVIAVFYSENIVLPALITALVVFAAILGMRAGGLRRPVVYGLVGLVVWVALLKSGVDPVVVGLALGLLTYAYPASRSDLERASDLFRSFREQPTAELERSARLGIALALSPNDRLQRLYHPWTSYAIVPLFALANAGLTISGSLLASAVSSPVTWGIFAGYVLGKPVAIAGTSWLTSRFSGGGVRPPVGWGAVVGGGTIAGVGFTVSLLIASLAFRGRQLDEAKIGILSAMICAFALTWAVSRVIAALPKRRRDRLLLGSGEGVLDLAVPVDEESDHVRGPAHARVTVVEYGDFQCPYCGQAEPVIRELLADEGDVRYVWRHLPLNDVHPEAQLAAEAAEAAAEQGAFWEMHDRLFLRQSELEPKHLMRHAESIGLDSERFRDALRSHSRASRIARDIDSADISGVSGTPTFFVNGRRHHGAYDIDALTAAVQAARDRADM
jgi:Na+/H+ antiporter NhaA